MFQSGHGGDVTIQAGANVELNASTVQAKGATAGSNRTGGTIDGRSFNGSLLGNAPGVLDANAGAPRVGAITLTACVVVNYTGTTLPTAVTATGVCGGNPVMPAAFLAALNALADDCAQAPDCVDGEKCTKRGRKFNADNNMGLADWQICAFDSSGTLVGSCVTTTSPNGEL